MSLLGLVASAWGASKQNKANAREAATSRAFNERLSRNKHQYETEDLKKAGLNRILSITNGATAGSSSAQARHENVGEAGVRGATSAAQLKLINAQTRLTDQKTVTERGDPRNVGGAGIASLSDTTGLTTGQIGLTALGGAASAWGIKKALSANRARLARRDLKAYQKQKLKMERLRLKLQLRKAKKTPRKFSVGGGGSMRFRRNSGIRPNWGRHF